LLLIFNLLKDFTSTVTLNDENTSNLEAFHEFD